MTKPEAEVREAVTTEEKLAWLDQEVRYLQEYHLKQGLTPWQMETMAEPLLSVLGQTKQTNCKSLLIKCALVIGLVAGVVYYDPAYRFVCANGRLLSMKILPYWDWTKYYDNDCLIENPFYEANQLTEEDCMDCQNLNTIQRKSNVSQSEMAEDYLKGDIPVIITDAMMDWPAAQSFTIQQLYDLYTQHQSLKKSVACMFSTNVRLKAGKARELLAQASRGEIGNWYAHWENCDKAAGKAIRQLYKRPYFVPPMVEMAESNWLFVAASYKGKKYKPADLAISMMLFAQVRGDTKVMLTPRDPCSETCSTLYGTVHEGEILVATDLMWLLDYQPLSAEQTISIGFGGDFN